MWTAVKSCSAWIIIVHSCSPGTLAFLAHDDCLFLLFCKYFAAQSTRPIPQISTLNQSAQLTADELFFVFLLTKKMLEGLFAFSVFEFGETKPSLIFYRFWVGLVDRLFSGFGRRKNIISY